jgi:TetR/AcrR family transcriptional regulator
MSATIGKRKERLNGGARRGQIIDVALGLFAEKGFNGTRTRDIAEAAGISETLIFQYFRTKAELYRTSLQTLFNRHPVLPDIEKKISQKDDFGVFQNLALYLISHNQQDRRIVRLAIFSALEGFSLGEDSHSRQTATPGVPEILEIYIRERINDGAFKDISPQIVSRLFIEFVYAYILDQEAGISGPPLANSDEQVVDALVRIFMDGIRS